MTTPRDFHQARWNEPILFELSRPGQRGLLLPAVEDEVKAVAGDVRADLPAHLRRRNPPALPEMAQPQVVRHYMRLSQETIGADLNIDVGQGTCTMKYNPKVNERLARLPQMAELHPLQDESTVQGILEIVHRLEGMLREISGMDAFSLLPSAGSQAIYVNASIIRAYHAARGEADRRDEIITTIFSHPSDAAAPRTAGFKIITLYPEQTGYPGLEALKAALSDRTAGMMITNPEDTGIFNPRIADFVKLVHQAGGLCSYDQANANGILGITRAAEAGFDLCHFNLHKTFSTPHGSGGPACGAVGARRELARFLPIPVVAFDGTRYRLDFDRPDSIGRIGAFQGPAAVIMRAYAWIMSLGAEGLREAAEMSVLNNNYLMRRLLQIRGLSAPYAKGSRRIEQVRYSWEELHRDTGVTTEDIGTRAADYGVHYWTSHHPFVVPQPTSIEPPESYSKDDLDEYAAILGRIAHEAYTEPETVKTAPHRSVIHRVDPDPLNDPQRWAVTWRAYRRKVPGRA
jgi:glycine cleavage system P protein (glycine dehydrogenase) subunit 2